MRSCFGADGALNGSIRRICIHFSSVFKSDKRGIVSSKLDEFFVSNSKVPYDRSALSLLTGSYPPEKIGARTDTRGRPRERRGRIEGALREGSGRLQGVVREKLWMTLGCLKFNLKTFDNVIDSVIENVNNNVIMLYRRCKDGRDTSSAKSADVSRARTRSPQDVSRHERVPSDVS